MFQSVGSPMSPEVALRFSILFLSSDFLFVDGVFVLYVLVVPAVAWKAPKLSIVVEVGSEIM